MVSPLRPVGGVSATRSVVLAAVLAASLVILRLITPASPPRRKPESPAEGPLPPDFPAEPRPNPMILPPKPAAMDTPRAAIMASASMEPPVWPTLTPRLDRKLSIFWETFRKPTAQKNQISTLPLTVSLLVAFTAASTSLSSMAPAVMVRAMTHRSRTVNAENRVRDNFTARLLD